MNKATVYVVIAVIIVLGGGYGAYHAMHMPQSEKPATVNTNVAATEQMTTKTSLTSLLAEHKSVTCTYNSGNQKGTMYIANGHMRGDIEMAATATAQAYTMHTINDGQWNYSWGGPLGETQGVKMKMMATTNANVNVPEYEAQTGISDAAMDYSCTPWTMDATVFTVPANVNFKDVATVGGTMQGSGQGTSTTTVKGSVNVNVHTNVNAKVDCSVCDQTPEGIARIQCRQALGC